MTKKIIGLLFVAIFLSFFPDICLAGDGQVVITSFYSGISVSLMFFIAALLNAGYIFNFLWNIKAKSHTLISLGSFWFFCGITALLLSLSSYMHSILHVQSFLIDIITYIIMTGHGVSIAYHIVYKIFYSKKIALIILVCFIICVLVFIYFVLNGQWRGVVESDWGTVVLRPAQVKYMAIILAGIITALVFVDFFIRSYRALKEKSQLSRYEFAIDIPIVIFYLAGTLQANDLPGWRLVLDQTFMVIAALFMFTLIYKTSGLSLLLNKEIEKSAKSA